MLNAFSRSGLLLTALALCVYFAASLSDLKRVEFGLQRGVDAQAKALKALDKLDPGSRAKLEAISKGVEDLAASGDDGAKLVIETLRQHGVMQVKEPVSPPASPSDHH
jgi:hypothetical protein